MEVYPTTPICSPLIPFHVTARSAAQRSPIFHSVISRGPLVSAQFIASVFFCRFRWPRGLRRGSAGARLLRLRVRIPPGKWMNVSCVERCQVERSLRRNRHSAKGILPSVVCLSMISKPQRWCGLNTLGLSSHEKKKIFTHLTKNFLRLFTATALFVSSATQWKWLAR